MKWHRFGLILFQFLFIFQIVDIIRTMYLAILAESPHHRHVYCSKVTSIL